MNDKKIKNLIFELLERAKSKERECPYKDCNLKSIKSHLIQKNGILNNISENGHLFNLTISPFQPNFFKFQQIGINEKALTFLGFCSKHDNELFKEIERTSPDLTSYNSMLLLSYKALMNEKRKKEIIIDQFNRVLNSNTLKAHLDDNYFNKLINDIYQHNMAINDCIFYENIFYEDLEYPLKENFIFKSIELDKLPICASGAFSFNTTREMFFEIKSGIRKEEEPFSQIFFHLLPTENSTLLIMGCLKKDFQYFKSYLDNFFSNDLNKSLRQITNLLLLQLENWLCSPSFYENNLKQKEQKIIEITRFATKNYDERLIDLNFNLFE